MIAPVIVTLSMLLIWAVFMWWTEAVDCKHWYSEMLYYREQYDEMVRRHCGRGAEHDRHKEREQEGQ